MSNIVKIKRACIQCGIKTGEDKCETCGWVRRPIALGALHQGKASPGEGVSFLPSATLNGGVK